MKKDYEEGTNVLIDQAASPSDIIDNLLKAKYPGLSVNKFAEKIGLPKSTLHDIRNRGIDNTSVQKVKLVAEGLGLTLEELVELYERGDIPSDFEDNGKGYKNDLSKYPRELLDNLFVRELPSVQLKTRFDLFKEEEDRGLYSNLNFYGSISAGKLESIEGIVNSVQINLPKIFLDKYASRDDVFVMRTNGDSMNEIIPNNSLVICVPVKDRSELNNNDIVIFSYNNETSMKRYRLTDNKVIFSPQSKNSDYFDLVIEIDTLSEVKILAKVISYFVNLD